MDQQGSLCLHVLLGVSLTSQEQVLGRTYMYAYGDSSGFFVSGRGLMRRKIGKLSFLNKKYEKLSVFPLQIPAFASLI